MGHDILIVDDERDICTLIAGILEDEGNTARRAHNSTEAIDAVRQRRPALVILDVWLQGSELDGLQLLDVIRREDPPVPVVMISGHGTIDTAVSAIKTGAYDFIEKPFKADRLLLVVDRAIEADKLRRENASLRRRAGGEVTFVGSSSAAAGVRAQLERVAPTGSRVLITGASGAGKETVARLIHQGSKRADGPFVVVNCSALPAERLEIELFGTDEEGAGDALRVSGAFEMAHGGTLLLKEVADLPLPLQSRLARVLQEQSFTRGGGTTKVEVDVRVLASTGRVLQDEIAAGAFREELYHRLNVVALRVPPLSERREDIRELANDLLRRVADATGLPSRTIGEDTLAALQGHDWPGNVRQLRNVIERLLILAPRAARRSAPTCCPTTSARMRRRCCAGRRAARSCTAAPRCPRGLRAGIPAGPGDAFRRQHLAHRDLRRHGTLGAASQAEVARPAWRRRRRAPAGETASA